MYVQLAKLPLLQGINATDLVQIQNMAQTYHVLAKSKTPFCKQGDLCQTLTLLVKGTVTRRHTAKATGDYVFKEELQAPWIIEPESLYGLNCTYSSDYHVTEHSTLLTLSKQDVARLFTRNEIFRMNYLNLVSTTLQHLRDQQLTAYTLDTEQRMAAFVQALSYLPTGPKTLYIKMEELARHMHETRLNVSRVLNHWQTLDLVHLQRKEIRIHRLEDLVRHAADHAALQTNP